MFCESIAKKYALKKYFSVFKSLIQCFAACFAGLFRSSAKPHFIIGSNYGAAPDPNINALASYLVSEGKTFVIVGGDSALPNVARGTLKAAYFFFSSKACFYTHSLSDVIPHAHKLFWLKKILKFPTLVFLQHGVIGLKSQLSNGVSMSDYLKSLEPTFDHMVVSSQREKDVVAQLGVPRNKIALTGLPRFDRYVSLDEHEKNVLIFFTWQDADILKQKVKEVSQSRAFKLLSEAGYTCQYHSHNMQEDVDLLAGGGIEDLDQAIQDCCLLITDDSSVAWDVLQRGREVVFYRPSGDWLVEDEFLTSRKCFNVTDLDVKVCAMLDEIRSEHYKFAEYNNGGNCERLLYLVNN